MGVVLDAHQKMVHRPIGLGLHAGQVVEAAVSLVERIAFAIEIDGEELADPFFILFGNREGITKFPGIRVHQHVHRRHIAQAALVELLQAAVVVAHAALHMVQGFHRDAILVTDIIHQVMVVVAA